MTKMILPMVSMPAAIAESAGAVLNAHGLSLSPELLREIGRNATQSLFALDESLTGELERPSNADMLAVGETLRALAAAGRPNADTAPALARVGTWLSETARADLAHERKAKADADDLHERALRAGMPPSGRWA